MQLTKFDHWLKQKYVYETHIFCLRLPDKKLSRRVKVESLEVKKKGDYKYKLTIQNNDYGEYVLDVLKKERVMHAAHIVNGKGAFNKFIMPDGGKSFTYQLLGRILILISICSACFGIYRASQNEEVRAKVKSAIEELNVK